MAPRTGPRTAITATAIVLAHAKRAVATDGARPAAATSLKNNGKTAVMIVVWKAELAQSYIAQARSSRRWRPRRWSTASGFGLQALGLIQMISGTHFAESASP